MPRIISDHTWHTGSQGRRRDGAHAQHTRTLSLSATHTPTDLPWRSFCRPCERCSARAAPSTSCSPSCHIAHPPARHIHTYSIKRRVCLGPHGCVVCIARTPAQTQCNAHAHRCLLFQKKQCSAGDTTHIHTYIHLTKSRAYMNVYIHMCYAASCKQWLQQIEHIVCYIANLKVGAPHPQHRRQAVAARHGTCLALRVATSLPRTSFLFALTNCNTLFERCSIARNKPCPQSCLYGPTPNAARYALRKPYLLPPASTIRVCNSTKVGPNDVALPVILKTYGGKTIYRVVLPRLNPPKKTGKKERKKERKKGLIDVSCA